MDIQQFSKGTLNGKPIIPVCCMCSKVRDIANQWHSIAVPEQVETSHTYCPPCKQAVVAQLKQYLS